MPWTEYDKGKIESYMLAVQHIFGPPGTPRLSAPGNVGVDEQIDIGVDEPIDADMEEPIDIGVDELINFGADELLDVGYTDPPTISEPETGRTCLPLFLGRMSIAI